MEGIAMGSYGAYVWSAFSLAAIVVAWCEWQARVKHKRVFRDIEVRIKALEDHE